MTVDRQYGVDMFNQISALALGDGQPESPRQLTKLVVKQGSGATTHYPTLDKKHEFLQAVEAAASTGHAAR